MSHSGVSIAAISTALIAGFLHGGVSAKAKLRQTRPQMAASRRLAELNPLTDLPNRAGAQRHLQLQAAAGRAPAAVLLDLDELKAVNDTWGHQAGDAVLIAVAQRVGRRLHLGSATVLCRGDQVGGKANRYRVQYQVDQQTLSRDQTTGSARAVGHLQMCRAKRLRHSGVSWPHQPSADLCSPRQRGECSRALTIFRAVSSWLFIRARRTVVWCGSISKAPTKSARVS